MENTNKIIDTTDVENGGGEGSTKNFIFWLILILFILGSIGATFYRIVILKDYQIMAETPCDPDTEKCFVRQIEPEPCAEGDTACLANPPVTETDYYKIIEKKASSIEACEQTEEKANCGEALTCAEGEEDCSYTFCSADSVPEGESCLE